LVIKANKLVLYREIIGPHSARHRNTGIQSLGRNVDFLMLNVIWVEVGSGLGA